jgi:hypothetical protein
MNKFVTFQIVRVSSSIHAILCTVWIEMKFLIGIGDIDIDIKCFKRFKHI